MPRTRPGLSNLSRPLPADPMPTEPQLPQSGDVVNDRYEVVRQLGQGGMGAVYLVYDRQERQDVALKSFPPKARRPEDLLHFQDEFRTLSRLRHPNIARVFDFGVIEASGDVFFTTEVIEGRDLLAATEGLPEGDLVELIVGVCRGLAYIHSREIIHYDVKPTNVLVTRDEAGVLQAKLIDFGLASQRVDDALGVIKGTVSFLAPEVARQVPVDHRVDLYSLGVTLFQCATGRLPFQGETNLDVVRQVITADPPDPQGLAPRLSDALRGVILKLLAKDPGARYSDGNEVIRALGRATGRDYAAEPLDAALHFVFSGTFCGRDDELVRLTRTFDALYGRSVPPSGTRSGVRSGTRPRSETIDLLSTESGGFVLDSDPGSAATPVRAVPSSWTNAFPSADPNTAAEAPPEPPGTLPHVVLVSGELGVGKSRLLAELKTHAQLNRVAVVEGRGGTNARPYAPFVQAFRDLLGLWRRPGGSGLKQRDDLRRRLLQRYGAELVRLIPELDDALLPVARHGSSSPAEEELRLLDALAQFLIGYGRGRPLLVLLHDLEAADLESLELLRYLCRNLGVAESARALARRAGSPIPPIRLMVVGTYRETDADDGPQGAALRSLADEEVVDRMELAPLGRDDVYALIASMLGAGTDPRRLADRIYDDTKGNPHFTVELMRSLVEEQILVRREGRWEVDWEAADAQALPESVSEVILTRAQAVADEEREPLEALAVLGRAATVYELAALLERDVQSLLGLLGRLVRRQVLFSEERADARYHDFAHDLARTAIYDTLEPATRVALHERCAGHLERRAQVGTGGIDAGQLVRHFAAAGDRAKALEYGVRAGDEARAVHAHHQAIGFYGDALALLPPGSARWRDLFARTGDLLALVGDTEQAARVYRRLASPELAERCSPAERIRAARRLGEILERRGDYDGALEALSEGTAAAYGADGLEREAAALFAATASIYLQTGRYEDALGFCQVGLGRLVGLSEGEEAVQIRTVLARSRLALGQLAEAERELERCMTIRRRMGDEQGVAQVLGDLGLVALEAGRLDEAVARFERAMERENALGHVGGGAVAARRLARACLRRGEHERAASLLRRALAVHDKTGDRGEAIRTRLELARARTALGQYEEALDELGRARKASHALGLRAEEARALGALAELHVRAGQADDATMLANEALRLASLHGDLPRERAFALEGLASAHRLRGDDDRAEQLLHEAQALYRRQEDPAGVYRTTDAVLRILLRRGATDLAQATLDALDEAHLGEAERAWLLLLRADAALVLEKELDSRPLGLLERAAAAAERLGDRELAWRVAAARGRALDRLGSLESGLQSLVEAMSGIRAVLEQLPAALRPSYLGQPDCLACRDEFSRLRSRLTEDA